MMKNRKWIKGIVLGLLLGISVNAVPVEAATAAPPKKVAPLPEVEVVLKGAVPGTPEDYAIKMQAEDAAYPMPEGTQDGVYTMTIKGAGKKALPSISYDDLGIYKYKIWQEAGTHSRATYDKSIYHMTVSVINNYTYDGYTVVIALYEEGVTEKQDKIVFENSYKKKPKDDDDDDPTPTPTPPPAPIESAKTGDSSHIGLYLLLMCAAAAGIVVVVLKRKRE